MKEIVVFIISLFLIVIFLVFNSKRIYLHKKYRYLIKTELSLSVIRLQIFATLLYILMSPIYFQSILAWLTNTALLFSVLGKTSAERLSYNSEGLIVSEFPFKVSFINWKDIGIQQVNEDTIQIKLETSPNKRSFRKSRTWLIERNFKKSQIDHIISFKNGSVFNDKRNHFASSARGSK